MINLAYVILQVLRETYHCEAVLKQHDKHILSFATYELGSIYFERKEVSLKDLLLNVTTNYFIPVYFSIKGASSTSCLLRSVNW